MLNYELFEQKILLSYEFFEQKYCIIYEKMKQKMIAYPIGMTNNCIFCNGFQPLSDIVYALPETSSRVT